MKNIAFTKRIFAAILAVSLLGCSAISVSAYDSEYDDPIPAEEPIPWEEPEPERPQSPIIFEDYYCLEFDNCIAIVGYCGTSEEVRIPAELNGLPVKKIDTGFFGFNFVSVFIPSTVEYIGSISFQDPFGRPNTAESITVDDNNPFFSSYDGILYNKDKTELIKCPPGKQGKCNVLNGTETIKAYAFQNCECLTNITLPNTLRTIEQNAFYYCSSLKFLRIPEGVKRIGETCLMGCTGLRGVIIPDTAETTSYDSDHYNDDEPYPSAGMIGYYNGNPIIFGSKGSIAEREAEYNNLTFLDLDAIKSGKNIFNPVLSEDGYAYFVYEADNEGIYEFNFTSEQTVELSENINLAASYSAAPSISKAGSKSYYLDKGEFVIWKFANFDDNVESLKCDNIKVGVSFEEVKSGFGSYMVKADNGNNNKFVLKAPADDVYVFELSSDTSFYQFDHGSDEYGSYGYATSSTINRYTTIRELKKDQVIIFEIDEAYSDVKVTVSNTYSDYCGSYAIYTYSSYNASVKGVSAEGSGQIYTTSNYGSAFNKVEDFVKNVYINSGITYIGNHAFYRMNNLEKVYIPRTVAVIADNAFDYRYFEPQDPNLPPTPVAYDDGIDKVMDYITIYGYSGSYAESYAAEKGIPFVALNEITDDKTQIVAVGEFEEGTKLDVKELAIDDIVFDESNREIKAYFDIRLVNGENEVKPESPVTIRIPYSGAVSNVEVFRLNEDGTKDKMNCTYDGGYISFVTDHFSKYIVVANTGVLGDTNGDGIADIADSLMISRYDAGLITLDDAKVAVSDVNNDGSADIADALKIARFDAGLIDSLS